MALIEKRVSRYTKTRVTYTVSLNTATLLDMISGRLGLPDNTTIEPTWPVDRDGDHDDREMIKFQWTEESDELVES